MLELADDMAIDIPHIWLYLAELLSPVLKEGGFSMRELFRYRDGGCGKILKSKATFALQAKVTQIIFTFLNIMLQV